MKIYLSPSMQPNNVYAAGDTNEQIQCSLIASYARDALLRCGFEAEKAPEGQSAEENIARSNAWGADLHVPIHTNAGGGRGCVVFVYALTDDRLLYADAIFEAINGITLYPSVYGVRTAGFYEIRASNAMCLYVECEFHDSEELALWIIDNVKELGEAICRGICAASGVAYVPEDEASERWQTLEEIPEPYRETAELFIEKGALRGKTDGGLDVTEDMLRVMEIIRRYFEE